MEIHPDRNNNCRLTTDLVINGYKAVILENKKLRVTVLADKGTDIYEFLYKPLDIDFMWRSPMGLRNQRNFVPSSSSSNGNWYDYYEGGWQDIFPSAGPPCTYKGAEFGLHGESSIMPWEFKVISDSPQKISVMFWVRLYRSPFYVEKTITLEDGQAILMIDEKIVNEAEESMHLVWGYHPALGGNFLNENCVIDTDAQRISSMSDFEFETQRMPKGKNFSWPNGKDKSGKEIDFSKVPPPDNKSADMLYMDQLKNGWFAVTDQVKGIGFGMVWPKEVFPYLWMWQVCGGLGGYPWYGRTYNMALEIFTSLPGLGVSAAVENGSAVLLQSGEEISAKVKAVVYHSKNRIKRITSEGKIIEQ